MVYADYTHYTQQFRGQMISEAAFLSLARKVSSYLDFVTFNRLRKLQNPPDEAKDACCALVELLYKAEEEGGKAIAKETVGKHSVSYVEQESIKQQMHGIASQYLAHTGLLYRGVM